MAKRPTAGATKTRLTPTLSPAQAADLYEGLLIDTIDTIQRRTDCTPVIAIDQPASAEYFSSIAPAIAQVEQVGDSLGHRLDSVLSHCLELGFESVFAIGSDSPDLPPSHLDSAFLHLDRDDVDVVLGPAEDGGYYLIGWKQRWGPMVTNVIMSTPTVLDDTLAVAKDLGAGVVLVDSWYDVDTPADLLRLRESVAGSGTRTDAFLADL